MGSKAKKNTESIRYSQRKSSNLATVFNLGYMGVGSYSSYNSYKIYQCWCDMFKRCYCTKFLVNNPTYIDCSVDPKWHNFQNFAAWYEKNWKPWMDSKWHLDKDILIPGNKVYGPDTCCFIPREINFLFTSVRGSKSGLPRGVQKRNGKFIVETKRLPNKKKTYLKPESPFKNAEETHEAWKEYKTNYIRRLTEEYREKLDFNVYNTLIKFKL